ncbi:Extended synaptotagmin-1 [Coemansia sp. RSA 1646]|nr:Extended synaptotagmin-1 [Coemansia sp. RSA 1646]
MPPERRSGSGKATQRIKGVLRLKVLKGKDVPHKYPQGTSSQYVVIRVGSLQDYCFPVANTSGEPRFAMTSYFNVNLLPDTLVEITVYNDGRYRDSAVGRVTVPLKELHGVRDYHEWLVLNTSLGDDPAGSVYLDSRFRTESDGEYEVLINEHDNAMSDTCEGAKGHQRRRMKQKRYQGRVNARRRKYIDAENKPSKGPGIFAKQWKRVERVFSRNPGRSSDVEMQNLDSNTERNYGAENRMAAGTDIGTNADSGIGTTTADTSSVTTSRAHVSESRSRTSPGSNSTTATI